MNPFATSEAVSTKSPEQSGSGNALFEDFDVSKKLLTVTNGLKSIYNDALVQSGLLPELPLDGFSNESVRPPSNQLTGNLPEASQDCVSAPRSSEDTLSPYELTQKRGQLLAHAISYPPLGYLATTLVEEARAAGDLEGTVAAANQMLEKIQYPSRVALVLDKQMRADISLVNVALPRQSLSGFSLEQAQGLKDFNGA
jgi:hypothetical protein